ncbi:MAG: hypothetical protein AAF170_03545 [Bacteroidota bacterium]
MNDAATRCLYIVGDQIRQRARTALEAARGDTPTEAEKARAFAFLEVIGLLLHEGREHGLSPADLGLGGFNPDLDLPG